MLKRLLYNNKIWAAGLATLLLGACAQAPILPPPQASQNRGIVVQQVPVDNSYRNELPRLRPDPDPGGRYEPSPNRTASASQGSNPFSNQPERPVYRYRGTPTIPPPQSSALDNATYGAPAASRAVPGARSGGASGIVLGEGDVILFNMFGQEDMETTAFVSAQGTVSLPLIGDTQVGGLTPGQAEQKIAGDFRNGGFFKNPQVNVTLETYRSQQISVLGEVNLPGRYPLETQTTVLDALAQAEGVKPTGSRVITVIRKAGNGSSRFRVDLDSLVTQGEQSNGVQLIAGDIVYVPEAELFYIYGEVRRPDAYAIKPGITLMQALSLGGGLTDKGSNSRIEIQRKSADGLRTIKPDLRDPVRPDDVIYVKERFF